MIKIISCWEMINILTVVTAGKASLTSCRNRAKSNRYIGKHESNQTVYTVKSVVNVKHAYQTTREYSHLPRRGWEWDGGTSLCSLKYIFDLKCVFFLLPCVYIGKTCSNINYPKPNETIFLFVNAFESHVRYPRRYALE